MTKKRYVNLTKLNGDKVEFEIPLNAILKIGANEFVANEIKEVKFQSEDEKKKQEDALNMFLFTPAKEQKENRDWKHPFK